MFEGAVASLLNRLLGRYVEDLDTEHFNVGIFSGDTCLTDLKLKPEALYQLGLPIRLEIGLIGKVSLKIPWTSLSSQPIILCVEDIYAIAVPAISGTYDSEVEKRLVRAAKKKILEDLDEDGFLGPGVPAGLLDSLVTSVIRNFQITVNNVHVRYEDNLTSDSPIACGICIQSLSISNTNNKWKPGVIPTDSSSTYQLARAESLSVYLDPDAKPSMQHYPAKWELSTLLKWKDTMYKALQTFGMNDHDFQFLMKPFTVKVKVIINKSNEARVPRMLVDIVLQDVATQITERQYVTLCRLHDFLQRVTINRPYWKYRPAGAVRDDPRAWWWYAYSTILERNVRPYVWEHVRVHRTNYRKYRETFVRTLLRPNDVELRLDLQKFEDALSVLNVVIAREHGKTELREREPGRVAIDTRESGIVRLIANCERLQGFCAQLSSPDSKDLLRAFNYDAEAQANSEKPSKHIDHKYNFTLANCSLSFLRDERDVVVVSLTQFLACIETRLQLSAYKISARAESFVIEGLSSENELVPLITADNILTGNVSSNFLAIDFEKNPSNSDCNYDISVTLEPIEVTYHKYAVSEILKFFKASNTRVEQVLSNGYSAYKAVEGEILEIANSIISRNLRINLKMDLKGPYIVFPEHTSVQDGGNLLLFDTGRMVLRTELQSANVHLEDATLMELEMLLYDRLHMDFIDGQILLCHSGDDWREVRKRKDSENHFVPKMQASVILSRSIRPEYRLLPRTKLNVSVSSLKLNVSTNKLRLVMHFLDFLSIPNRIEMQNCRSTSERSWREVKEGIVFSLKELARVRSVVALSSTAVGRGSVRNIVKNSPDCTVPEIARSVISSEISDEDLEHWTRSVDLPGFDDNVSPHNHINLLLRFSVGELSFHLEHVVGSREKPYLVLRICTLYFEAALMEYGPAIQFGIGTVVLADKTSAGVTGSYLELISTDGSCEVLTVLFRKVRANCPDFKSHFKSIERSLVVDAANINVIFHRYAFLELKDYCGDLIKICRGKTTSDILQLIRSGSLMFWVKKKDDPPIPPGAIKLSYSARLSTFVLRLCDRDADLLELKVSGVESDCVYKANERMVLRAHIRSISVNDLGDFTLYSKILTTDDDKVLDLKYVRHTPKLYAGMDVQTKQDDVMSDGSFRLSVGKLNCVLIAKMLHECQNFLEPFLLVFRVPAMDSLKNSIAWSVERCRNSTTKLHISIDFQGPILLLPQKRDVPSLLVFDMGVLAIENFFKKKDQPSQPGKANGNNSYDSIIDNILIKLKSVTISRAVMTLSGNLETQEPILEPIYVRFDAKRKVEYRSAVGFQVYGLCDVRGSLDLVTINVSQKDLMTILAVWEDNVSRLSAVRRTAERKAATATTNPPAEVSSGNSTSEDAMVKKLEVFLAQNEQPACEINAKLTLDGLQLNLFSDTEEVLSSPVRDLNHGLCKLTVGEVAISLDVYNDRSLNMKVSVRSCLLEDTRKLAVVVRKIIQSPSKTTGVNLESCISISTPPTLDVMFTRAPAGDKCFDMLVEETRINFSVPFLIHVGRYFADSIPGEQVDKGVVNRGYEGDGHPCAKFMDWHEAKARDASTGEDKTLDRAAQLEEQPGSSISIRIRKPEILLFGDLKASNAHAILFQAEVTIESSQHNGLNSIVCTLSDVRAKSKSQERYLKQPPHWVLHPCDIEMCRKEKLSSRDVEVTVAISSANIHLSAGTVQTFLEIIREVSSFLRCNETDAKTTCREVSSSADLWSQKKISSIPYKRTEGELSDALLSGREHYGGSEIFELKPVSTRVQLELEDTIERLPIAMAETEISATIHDWNNKVQTEALLKIQASCYNAEYGMWEPLVERCSRDDNNCKPWELTLKTYQAEAYTLSTNWPDLRDRAKEDLPKKKKKEAESSEDEATEDMVFVRPDHVPSTKISETNCNLEYDEGSDTDDDEGVGKLSRTFNRLFIKDSSEGEGSDTDESSNEDEGLELTPEHVAESHYPIDPCTVGIIPPTLATYVILHAEETINCTVTPNTVAVLDIVLNTFLKRSNGIPILPTSAGKLNLNNDIGYASRVELLVKEEGKSRDARLVAAREFKIADSPVSPPSSPEAELQANADAVVGIENGFMDQGGGSLGDSGAAPLVLFPDESVVSVYRAITEERLRIQMEGFEDTLVYCPKRQGRKLLPLRPARHGIRYHLIAEVKTDRRLHRTITVRSPLQIRNETSYALGLYYKKPLAEKLKVPQVGEVLNPFDDNLRMTVIVPDHVYNVPLYVAYHFPIHVVPEYGDKYQVSEGSISWKELSDGMNVTKDIYCNAKEPADESVFGVRVICNEAATSVNTNMRVPQYEIRILPPLVLDNRLPFAINVKIPSLEYEVRIEPEERIKVYSMKRGSDTRVVLEIQNYLGTQWTGAFVLTSDLERKIVKMCADNESEVVKPFTLFVELDRSETWVVVVYAQYWIVNKTGLPLHIREVRSNVAYEILGEELVMFSQKKSRRRLVRLRADQSGWSPSFGLDAVGSTALILCKDAERRRKYRIQAEIATSHLSPLLTKIVTFLPTFVVNNKAKRTLRFMEENDEADLWYDLSPGQGIAFWPHTDSMRMRVKWNNSQLVSQHFDITKIGKTVLRMDNGTALSVDVEGGETSPFSITFQRYQNGDAPVRVDNLCEDLFLKINQVDMGQAALLSPFQSLLYTWDDPSKNKKLAWNVYNNKTKGYAAQFQTDGYGQETVSFRTLKRSKIASQPVSFSEKITSGVRSVTSNSTVENNSSSSDETDSEADELEVSNVEQIRKDKAVVYWVSFLERQQRVLLFTQDENIFLKARSLVEPESAKVEVFCALAGVGLSIIVESKQKARELAYVGITDSAALWELCIGKKWKTLTLELSAWMEDRYKNSLKKAQFNNFIDVDFAKMHMTKPFFGKLRRTYSPGIWMHCRKSISNTYVQGKIHRLQIDDQLPDSLLPVVLHSGPQQYLTTDTGIRKLKSCVEFLCLKQKKTTHDVYKRIDVIVRKLCLNLHEEFVVRFVNDLLPKRKTKPVAEGLRRDLAGIRASVFSAKDKNFDAEGRTVVENIYISPIKMQLKLTNGTEGLDIDASSNTFNYRGITRYIFDRARRGSSEKNALFRLPCYEKSFFSTTSERLLSDVQRSYASRVVQQFNVLILSLTVVGNPYGYNLSTSGDDFYETDFLSVCGDEVAEKLNYDVACFLGHATADAMQPAILNFESSEYHTSRNKDKLPELQTEDIPPAPVLSADRSFSVGVELEMSGLVVAPTNSIYQEELKNFFKALGKGILGISKKENVSLNISPGLIVDTIKRAQEMGYGFVSRIRLPRYINPYLGVESYSTRKATGTHLLNTISKGHYAHADAYWAHAALSDDGKHIALISLRRVFLIEKRSVWGAWNVEWTIEINQLVVPPSIAKKKLILHVNKNEDVSCLSAVDWYLESDDRTILEWLRQKIEIAIILNMENTTLAPGMKHEM